MEEEEREKKKEGLVFYFCWKEGNEQSFLKKQSEMKWLNAKFSVFVKTKTLNLQWGTVLYIPLRVLSFK